MIACVIYDQSHNDHMHFVLFGELFGLKARNATHQITPAFHKYIWEIILKVRNCVGQQGSWVMRLQLRFLGLHTKIFVGI